MTGLLFAFLLATPQERPPLLSLEVGSPEPAEAHLPTAPGTTWTYRWTHDYVAPGTTDTITARWTQEVTITDTVRTQHGLILLRGERVSDRTATTRDGRPFPLQESDRFVSPAASLLLRGPNVYEVTGSHDELDSWIVRLEEHTPILFFPMQTGLRWSNAARERTDLTALERWRSGIGGAPNPGMYYWVVESVRDADPGPVHELWYRTVGGPYVHDYVNGVGIVRYWTRHQGSYWETSAELVGFEPGSG